jgi:hypothetical protein
MIVNSDAEKEPHKILLNYSLISIANNYKHEVRDVFNSFDIFRKTFYFGV